MLTVEEVMSLQVHTRLRDEAGVYAGPGEVHGWSLGQKQEATRWMDALLRRKEGHPFSDDSYEAPSHVKAAIASEFQRVVDRERRALAAHAAGA